MSIRPAVDFGSEIFPLFERCVSDIAQIFHNDAPCAGFNRIADQLLTCHMEQVHRYGSFIPAHALQQATSGTSANGLDGSAGAPDTGATVIQHPAVEEKCFMVGRVGGDQHPLDAHVHADNAAFGFKFGNLNFVGEAQIPHLAYALHLGIFPAESRYLIEFECKRSISDFRANAAKHSQIMRSKGYADGPFRISMFPRQFYFCVTEQILDKAKDELPEFAGIASCDRNGGLTFHKNAPVLKESKRLSLKECA